MLLTQREWNKLISGITRTCDKRLIKPLQTKHQKVERHFATDYSNSQGVVELGSPPTDLWVSVDIWQDLDKLDDWDGEILIGEMIDVTPLVELENGETLSDQEAIDGLGSFLPELSEPIKKEVRDGWTERVPGARVGKVYDPRTSGEDGASAGTSGASHRGGRSGIRRSPYRISG
jgi:hypothetical protein